MSKLPNFKLFPGNNLWSMSFISDIKFLKFRPTRCFLFLFFSSHHLSEPLFALPVLLCCWICVIPIYLLLLSCCYSGKELSATIENLRPATDYHVRFVFKLWHCSLSVRRTASHVTHHLCVYVSSCMHSCTCRVQAMCNCLQGSPSEPASFTTLSCEPDTPSPPRKTSGTKSSLVLLWKVQTHAALCIFFFPVDLLFVFYV